MKIVKKLYDKAVRWIRRKDIEIERLEDGLKLRDCIIYRLVERSHDAKSELNGVNAYATNLFCGRDKIGSIAHDMNELDIEWELDRDILRQADLVCARAFHKK